MKKLILGLMSMTAIVLPAYAYDFVIPAQDSQSKQKENTAAQLNVTEEIQSQQVMAKPNLTMSVNPQKTIHLQGLEGRYALDCSVQKAHNLSYIVADKSITRMISTQRKQGLFENQEKRSVSNQDGFKYLHSTNYQGFRVDFFTKDNQNWIKVKNKGLVNKFGPKTAAYLMQCPTKVAFN